MQTQFSFFGGRPLFDAQTLARMGRDWRDSPIAGLSEKSHQIAQFSTELTRIQQSRKKGTKETELEQAFNRSFFVELLGYVLYPGHSQCWTAWPKPKSAETGLSGEPDMLLGEIGDDGVFVTAAVVELKRPGTPLDGPQASYGGRSPVEQAFDYARDLATCRWVIVTDMIVVRLYSIATEGEFHEISLYAGATTGSFDQAYRLLAFANLVAGRDDSATSRLLRSCRESQLSVRDVFYKIYADIRADLLNAVSDWSGGSHSRQEMVLAVQRLLDRLLFIFFCEHHPDRLLRSGLIKNLTESAVRSPGASNHKIYDQLKALFHDLDVGVDTRFWVIPKYNGELFKPDPLLDSLVLPDSLHQKLYVAESAQGKRKIVNGIYGLHEFDFWRELDRDLLGNVFERSIGDLEQLSAGRGQDVRRVFGVYYTASRLARFAATSVVAASLEENHAIAESLTRVATTTDGTGEEIVLDIVESLKNLRIADLSCGSGVFLTAALDALLAPYRKALEALSIGQVTKRIMSFRQSEILRSAIYGIDILPQAVELSKLALWLVAARQNELNAELSDNLMVGNSLISSQVGALLQAAGGPFDLIVGNPPWGGEIGASNVRSVAERCGLSSEERWDSWEIFLALAVSSLKPGGRFALLVPDTLFSADKQRTRRWLLERTTLEKVYSLGPDWFTASVRMGTVLLQGKAANPPEEHKIATLILAGKERIAALAGNKPLQQIEAALAVRSRQRIFAASDGYNLQILASENDLEILERMGKASVHLSAISKWDRGDEINAEGIVWRCGNCMTYTVPGNKTRGVGYKDKRCHSCGANLTEKDEASAPIVSDIQQGPYATPYVDGRVLTRRYQAPVRRYMRRDFSPMHPRLKPDDVFKGPKILIRQAGVGITATIVQDDSRCPQSVYIYRVTEEAFESGYSEQFILGCLVSRTMNFVLMKRFGEIDPSRAFAKLTHARIGSLPIPKIGVDARRKQIAGEIEQHVKEMLEKKSFGSEIDMGIDVRLRALWGIDPDEGRYINGFFSSLPDGQAVRDLFPDGAPAPIPWRRRKALAG